MANLLKATALATGMLLANSPELSAEAPQTPQTPSTPAVTATCQEVFNAVYHLWSPLADVSGTGVTASAFMNAEGAKKACLNMTPAQRRAELGKINHIPH